MQRLLKSHAVVYAEATGSGLSEACSLGETPGPTQVRPLAFLASSWQRRCFYRPQHHTRVTVAVEPKKHVGSLCNTAAEARTTQPRRVSRRAARLRWAEQ